MKQSKVYFTTFKASAHENLLQKLHRLMKTAGFEQIDFTDKYAAIKIHFGEYGNLAFLRPNYAKVVADYIKELGGKPYLTDCNTLYVGSRKNALDHLDTAYVNGFSPLQTGCHVLIGDGLKGTDETLVPINGEYVKEAKIGHAIMDADVFISLTHFKGHEMAGFGGTLKNIGMGCGSRAGKMEQHCDVSPNCDCHAENDIPIIPNVGMLASFDPVALDVACADLCNKMTPVKESVLGENLEKHGNEEHHDHFHMTHPDTEWRSCVAHAVKIGLGTDQYELITI